VLGDAGICTLLRNNAGHCSLLRLKFTCVDFASYISKLSRECAWLHMLEGSIRRNRNNWKKIIPSSGGSQNIERRNLWINITRRCRWPLKWQISLNNQTKRLKCRNKHPWQLNFRNFNMNTKLNGRPCQWSQTEWNVSVLAAVKDEEPNPRRQWCTS
jgi:hypothetical protein